MLPAPNPVVADLRNHHLEHVKATCRPSTYVSNEKAWRRIIIPGLGEAALVATVKRSDVRRMHNAFVGTPSAANIALAVARSAFYLAEEHEWRPPGSNPCLRIKPHPEQGLQRPLSASETAAVWNALDECRLGRLTVVHPTMAAGHLLILGTGMRTRQAFRLEVAGFDLDARTATALEHKTSRKYGPMTVSMGSRTTRVMREHLATLKPPRRWAFPSHITGEPYVDVAKGWRRICQHVGLDSRLRAPQIRDARSGLATNALDAGEQLRVVQHQLGHSSIATTARYARVTPAKARATAQRIERALLQRRSGTSSG